MFTLSPSRQLLREGKGMDSGIKISNSYPVFVSHYHTIFERIVHTEPKCGINTEQSNIHLLHLGCR